MARIKKIDIKGKLSCVQTGNFTTYTMRQRTVWREDKRICMLASIGMLRVISEVSVCWKIDSPVPKLSLLRPNNLYVGQARKSLKRETRLEI